MSNRRNRTSTRSPRSWTTETKSSIRTTELYAYVAMVVAIVATALLVGDSDENGVDGFGASDALRYLTYLTIGYMLARGLAKAGSYEVDDDET
jgi:hypothetical protein